MADYVAPTAKDMEDRLARLFNPKVDAHTLNDREALQLIYKLAYVHGFNVVVTEPSDVLNVAYEHNKQISKAYAAQLLSTIHNDITDACVRESHAIIEEMIYGFVEQDEWPYDKEITNV